MMKQEKACSRILLLLNYHSNHGHSKRDYENSMRIYNGSDQMCMYSLLLITLIKSRMV